jgi:hypothetical protein
VVVRERVVMEIPVWTTVPRAARPIRLPRHARIGVSLAAPERVPAPEAEGPDVLRDGDGAPIIVMGRVIWIDRRMG